MKHLTALLLLCSGALVAQNDTIQRGARKSYNLDSVAEQTSPVKVISVATSGGGQLIQTGYQDIGVFRQAAPSSSLAFADLSQYRMSGFYSGVFGSLYSSTVKGIAVNVKFGCQSKFSEARFGIYHSRMGVSSQNYSYSTRTSIDTTTVPGGTLITDSVFHSAYTYNWYSQVLSLEAAWIARTNPSRILSFYAGFGMNFGAGFNGIIENSFFENGYYLHVGTGEASAAYVSGYTTYTDITERFRAPGFFFTTANIPVGMNIRLGKRNPVLRHVVLQCEYQGQLQMLFPSGADSQLRSASGFIGGIKWLIHPPKNHHGRKGTHHHKHYE
jgi:hypothetical protein